MYLLNSAGCVINMFGIVFQEVTNSKLPLKVPCVVLGNTFESEEKQTKWINKLSLFSWLNKQTDLQG